MTNDIGTILPEITDPLNELEEIVYEDEWQTCSDDELTKSQLQMLGVEEYAPDPRWMPGAPQPMSDARIAFESIMRQLSIPAGENMEVVRDYDLPFSHTHANPRETDFSTMMGSLTDLANMYPAQILTARAPDTPDIRGIQADYIIMDELAPIDTYSMISISDEQVDEDED